MRTHVLRNFQGTISKKKVLEEVRDKDWVLHRFPVTTSGDPVILVLSAG